MSDFNRQNRHNTIYTEERIEPITAEEKMETPGFDYFMGTGNNTRKDLSPIEKHIIRVKRFKKRKEAPVSHMFAYGLYFYFKIGDIYGMQDYMGEITPIGRSTFYDNKRKYDNAS